jgi:hypothetical protein
MCVNRVANQSSASNGALRAFDLGSAREGCVPCFRFRRRTRGAIPRLAMRRSPWPRLVRLLRMHGRSRRAADRARDCS